ncbi:hypothetical protein NQZ68_038190 [Dissostichus eleginoides]|nr:hypothetical protein NQZ68_038190 [Dissostichus eleginoides]
MSSSQSLRGGTLSRTLALTHSQHWCGAPSRNTDLIEVNLSRNPEESGPVFLELNSDRGGRVTLVRCRGPPMLPYSQLFLGDTDLTSSATSPLQPH